MTTFIARGHCLVLAAACVLPAALGTTATAGSSSAAAAARSECFEEGNGQRYCAELTDGCNATDSACLIDDFSGAILRAGSDRTAKYAAYLARGVVSRHALRVSDAIADFEAAQALQPKLAAPFILLGQVYSELGNFARALVQFDEANSRTPELPTILMHRAVAHQQLGNVGGAIADLTQAISVMRSGRAIPEGADETLEALFVARGRAWQAKGDVMTARTDFLAALAAKPGFAPAQEALGKLRF